MDHYDILIIGGGAAGIAAAGECGGAKVLLADRRPELGGVLIQCAHRGFGRNKDGPGYARDLIKDLPDTVELALDTTVLSVSPDRTALLSGKNFGRKTVSFSQLILASGCREIPAGALPIGGTRPRGVYTAGQMQELMNIYGYRPRGSAVILGSGDLGLIMAWHLAESGCSVTLVEQRDTCGGMAKNRRRLEGYPVRWILGDTVARIHGHPHITGCTTAGGEYIPCDSLLIAAGLRPERELIRDVEGADWLHICGNCNTVHPIVEAVICEGEQAGIAAYEKIRGSL